MNESIQEQEAQRKAIKEHLLKGNGISPKYADKAFGCMRLAARIFELRKDMKVYGKMTSHGRKRFKVYYLKNSPLFDSYGESY